MGGYFDRQDVQTPKTRDASLFRDLKGVLSVAKARAPALRAQLRGVDLSNLKTRADLARVPVVRKSELVALQLQYPPLGGFAAMRPGGTTRLLRTASSVYLPEGQTKDWWRAARAMHAAGVQRNDVVLNGFRCDGRPWAYIVESGAHALGCAVIPSPSDDVDERVEAVRRLSPSCYFGPSARLLDVLRAFDVHAAAPCPIKKALLIDGAPDEEHDARFTAGGVAAYRCYATEELGVIAYQSDGDASAMIVNEGFIVEVVKPGAADPLPFGAVGEIVVTRLSADLPLLRFATGDYGALSPGPSPCGRTNMRMRLAQASAPRMQSCASAMESRGGERTLADAGFIGRPDRAKARGAESRAADI